MIIVQLYKSAYLVFEFRSLKHGLLALFVQIELKVKVCHAFENSFHNVAAVVVIALVVVADYVLFPTVNCRRYFVYFFNVTE